MAVAALEDDISLHVDHGLLHNLKHLCLHNQHLLMSRRLGGGGLTFWLFSPLLLSLQFLVLPI
jgi:hypothetical protein